MVRKIGTSTLNGHNLYFQLDGKENIERYSLMRTTGRSVSTKSHFLRTNSHCIRHISLLMIKARESIENIILNISIIGIVESEN